MRMLMRCITLAIAITLSACQSPPSVPVESGLSEEQITVLRKYGFDQTNEGWELQMSGKLLFDFNADKLTGAQRAKIEKMAFSLHGIGINHLRVEGHTDDVGAAAYNEQLSLRRAQTVAQVLINAGIPKENVSVYGYGHTRPLPLTGTNAVRKENRRVAVVIPVP